MRKKQKENYREKERIDGLVYTIYLHDAHPLSAWEARALLIQDRRLSHSDRRLGVDPCGRESVLPEHQLAGPSLELRERHQVV